MLSRALQDYLIPNLIAIAISTCYRVFQRAELGVQMSRGSLRERAPYLIDHIIDCVAVSQYASFIDMLPYKEDPPIERAQACLFSLCI